MTKDGPERDVALTGTIERFTFRNPDSGWAVVRLRVEGSDELATVVGSMAQLKEGQRLRISGKEVAHPQFGRQVKVESFEAVAPSSEEGIAAYLASGLVRGIGPATAEKIVRTFGADTLRIIEDDPGQLRRVKGLGEKRVEELSQAVKAQKDLQNVLVFLRAHGLGAGLAARIVRRFGASASALVQANPYRLADEGIGIGFRTADRLAGQMGIAPEAPERLDAALEFTLGQAARDGHCYLPEALAEDGAARALDELLRRPRTPLVRDAEAAVEWFERTSGMALHEGQHDAVARALTEPVSVITGGPGVGKTTIVRALVAILAQKQQKVLLAAPTGRAAKRMEESTGHAASTLHRLLEYTPGAGRFARQGDNPLEGALLVVDEASMLDIQLAHALLQAVPPTMALALVGDRNQLPSVGPGNVLAEVIASGRVPVTALTQIFRQQEGSDIVRVAHGILDGEPPESGGESGDFFFIEARDADHSRRIILEVVAQRIPKRFGLDPHHDVQVLCPMYRGDVGADRLNRDLQDLLNPGQVEVERNGKRYRAGDRVMQIRNDYDREVWNGDVGRITHLDTVAARAFVRFPEREQEYRFEELSDLVPAYAISVHRSQGSEYPAVVLPVATEHFLMLKRSLLYTGITRGKKLVVVVGSRKALEMAVKNVDEGRRNSGLCERLRDFLRGDGVRPERALPKAKDRPDGRPRRDVDD